MLFDGRTEKEMVQQICELFGPLPPELVERGDPAQVALVVSPPPTTITNEAGVALSVGIECDELDPGQGLEGVLRDQLQRAGMSVAKVPVELIDFVLGMLAIHPADRKTVADLAKHPFVGVAACGDK